MGPIHINATSERKGYVDENKRDVRGQTDRQTVQCTCGAMAASHGAAVQTAVCFCMRVGLKPGPEGVRERQIRSFLSAHKRMRIYTRKCLSLYQIGFQSVPPEVGVVPTLCSEVVPVQVLKAYWEVEVKLQSFLILVT